MPISKAALRRIHSLAALLGVLVPAGTEGALAQAPSGPIAIRGRVLPLAGASAPPSSVVIELRAALLSFADQRAALRGTEPAALATAKTVGDGSFVLLAPAPGVYKISVRARGFRIVDIPLLPLVESIDLPPVEPAGLRPLSVTVLDPAGQPVGGATVRVESPTPPGNPDDPLGWRPAVSYLRTDSQGRATVERSVGEKFRVLGEIAGGAGFVEVEADAPWTVVRLASRPAMSLLVRDAAGRPAVGALVFSSGRPVAELGEGGGAEVLPPVPGGEPLLVVAEGGAWAEVAAPASAGGGKPVAIRLGPPRKARGRALESITGKPMTGALVWAAGTGGRILGVVRPDAQGSFEILVAGPGRAAFGAAAPEHAWRQLAAPVPGPRDLPIILRLDRAADPQNAVGLTGILLDEAGRPVGGAEIFAIRETVTGAGTQSTTRHTEQRLGTSDIHGGFHAGGLEPGTFDLVARANGFVPGRLPGLTLAAGGRLPNLKLVLSRGLRIEGLVRDPEGNPASGVTVEARRVFPVGQGAAIARPQPPQSSFVTDRGGHFKLTGLEPGLYEMTAENALGRARESIEVKESGGRIDLRLAIPRPDP